MMVSCALLLCLGSLVALTPMAGAEMHAMPTEFKDVVTQPPEVWRSKQAADVAARIVRRIEAGELTLSLPLGQLSVPDGILPTQMSILAHVYAAVGDVNLKKAFNAALEVLIAAQYPSGGWPTIYPKYAKWDLHGDMYADSTWNEIPALLKSILAGKPPFDSDIVSGLDRSTLEDVLSRIPPKASIKRFVYADYASRSLLWWKSEEAARIGDNLISWQMPHGGWWEDIAMAVLPYSPEQMTRSRSSEGGIERATFDDHGTIDPLRYLAKLYDANKEPRFRDAFYRGLDFVLAAQYASGGWPQSYPNPRGYSRYVTFNDNAMVNILLFIQDTISGKAPFGFVDQARQGRLTEAFDLGIEHILRAQVEVEGRLTAWAQQHDPFTYEPKTARAFEPVAISGNESVGVVELLRSIPDPSTKVKRAILSALEWFEAVQLSDGRWARFYEIGTSRPIFAGRDGIVRYDVSEIDKERQMNYAWFGTWPKSLLERANDGAYIDSLYEDLPEYPGLRVKFHSLRNRARVSGQVPVDISILHPSKEKGVKEVVVDVDDSVVYAGERLPERGELVINTELLEEGLHTLTVTTVHRELGTYHHSLMVNVNNIWRVVQELQPPLQSWLGVYDFLQTTSRSEGWGYDTEQKERFFGDPHRLVRTTDTEEHLIWETPRLRSLTLTAYIQGDTAIEGGLALAVSANGHQWRELAYQAAYEDASDSWRRVTIQADLDEASSGDWCRLTLTEGIAKERVQVGRVVLSGYHKAQGD